MTTPVLMPQMGLEVSEASVLRVLVVVGDRVAADQALFELETEKATVEVAAPAAGIVVAIHVKQEQLVPVGALLATIDAKAADAEAASLNGGALPRLRAAPAARRIAAERGIALETIAGTGPGGRITVRDVE